MIQIKEVSMCYPIPRRYVEMLTKPFAKPKYKTALSKVDLKIRPGDRVAFMGENGAGKTTLLKLIGGLLYPSKGNIKINDWDIIKENQQVRKAVGFVMNEERSFYWRLTAWQNLEFFGALDNLHGPALHELIRSLLEMVGLSDAADVRVSNFSSGMKQRLSIARGLLSDPSILILDEPTRALDPLAADHIREIILSKLHANTSRTLLIATHRFEEVEALCDHVCILRKGKILSYRSLEEAKEIYGSLNDFYTNITQNISS